jgi:hypothetical protein
VITALTDLPAGVIGFEITGKLEAQDYSKVLQPAIDRASSSGDVRIVIVIRDFQGMSGGAFWQDMEMGTHNWHKWKKIALVSDIDWMVHVAGLLGWMSPGELKTFPLAERAAAAAWAAA